MKDISFKGLLPILLAVGKKFQLYLGFFLFLLLAAIYGYTIVQISKYSDPVLTDDEVSSEVSASPTPRIDEAAADKLQSLEDNSVNVQTLFDEGRTNPFQE